METAKNVMEKLESEQRTARMPVGGKRYTKTLRNSAEPGGPAPSFSWCRFAPPIDRRP